MSCGCGKRRNVVAGGEMLGYYVIRPDGTEVPKVSKGERPFLSSLEAHAEVRRAGGGTVRAVRRTASR